MINTNNRHSLSYLICIMTTLWYLHASASVDETSKRKSIHINMQPSSIFAPSLHIKLRLLEKNNHNSSGTIQPTIAQIISTEINGSLVKDKFGRPWKIVTTASDAQNLQFRWEPQFPGLDLKEKNPNFPHVLLYFYPNEKKMHVVGEYPPVQNIGLLSTTTDIIYGKLLPGYICTAAINNGAFCTLSRRFFPDAKRLGDAQKDWEQFQAWIQSNDHNALALRNYLTRFSILYNKVNGSKKFISNDEMLRLFVLQYFTPQGRVRTKSKLMILNSNGAFIKVGKFDYKRLSAPLALQKILLNEWKVSLNDEKKDKILPPYVLLFPNFYE